jgi:hypothetical protein
MIHIWQASLAQVTTLSMALLDDTGRIRLYPAAFYAAITATVPDLIMAWGNLNGRYVITTIELVNWLKDRIGGRTALEVAAGVGDLGHYVGIPMTDSYQQVKDPATVAYFEQHGITPTMPLPDVEEQDAETAVRLRKPQVVVASWLTQRWTPGDEFGNMYGPMEEDIISQCDEYIFIGNKVVHGHKRILKMPHKEFQFPWLVSRSKTPEHNVIWVWSKHG